MVEFSIFSTRIGLTMFDTNKKHSFIQDLQSIGLAFIKELETENAATMVFDHRGKQVLIEAELVNGEITKLINLVIDDKVIDLQLDCASTTEAEFNTNLDLYVSLLNKEILKLDEINT